MVVAIVDCIRLSIVLLLNDNCSKSQTMNEHSIYYTDTCVCLFRVCVCKRARVKDNGKIKKRCWNRQPKLEWKIACEIWVLNKLAEQKCNHSSLAKCMIHFIPLHIAFIYTVRCCFPQSCNCHQRMRKINVDFFSIFVCQWVCRRLCCSLLLLLAMQLFILHCHTAYIMGIYCVVFFFSVCLFFHFNFHRFRI